jgi:hypothetical protein
MAELEARVRSDPGAAEFPALAEALRVSGRPEAAEEVARRGLEHKPDCAEGCLVLALALLDQGSVEGAHRELAERAGQLLSALGADASAELESIAELDFDGALSENELDQAFASAAPDREQLIDADRMAHEAMRAADLDEPESVPPEVADPIFATQTMAELLERQGDASGAARIRAEITPQTIDPWPRARHERVIETLETWLANLRRIER